MESKMSRKHYEGRVNRAKENKPFFSDLASRQVEPETEQIEPAGTFNPGAGQNVSRMPAVTPQNILSLQRTIGNQAVQRLIQRQKIQGQAGATRKTGEIQRRFGFEIEMPLYLTQQYTSSGGTNWYGEPKYDDFGQPIVAKHPAYNVHVDHNDAFKATVDKTQPIVPGNDLQTGEKGPIVELVTPPWDEFQIADANAARAKMQPLVDFATNAQPIIANAPYRDRLNTVVPGANQKLYVGKGVQNNKEKIGGQIQVTYGIKLDRVQQFFGWHATKVKAGSKDLANFMEEGAANGDTILDDMWKRYSLRKLKDRTDTTSKRRTHNLYALPSQKTDMGELRGLLILISSYLRAGTKKSGFGWAKNQLGQHLYKSKLSDVRNTLPFNQRRILATRDRKIADMIMARNNRQANENLFLFKSTHVTDAGPVQVDLVPFTCWDWLKQILNGDGDALFEAVKNAYGSSIKPEKIGPQGAKSTAAVMENRKLERLIPSIVANQGGRHPNEWLTLAEKIYKLMRAVNDVNAPSNNDLDQALT
jgi:hypothetical protein